MIPITSNAIRAVGYDADSRTTRVAFRGGGIYDYLDVGPELYERMLEPHPWRRCWRVVKAHEYRRVARA